MTTDSDALKALDRIAHNEGLEYWNQISIYNDIEIIRQFIFKPAKVNVLLSAIKIVLHGRTPISKIAAKTLSDAVILFNATEEK